MAWVRIDDRIAEHPKFLTLNDAGWSLWARTLIYANRHRTEGVLDAIVVKRMGTGRTVRDLVRRHIWDPLPGGHYRIHDYLDYQPDAQGHLPRAAVSAARAAAGRKGAERRWHGPPRADSKGIANDDNAMADLPSDLLSPMAKFATPDLPRSRDPEYEKSDTRGDLTPVGPVFAELRRRISRQEP
jgi:hypothetical protein